MSVTVATDENFKNEVLESDRPALVDFLGRSGVVHAV